MARSPKRKRRGTNRRTPLGIVARVVGALAAACAIAAVAVLAWNWPRCSGSGCPSVAALRSYTPPQASQVLDRRGRLVAHLAPERRIVVPLSEIPPHVAAAFVAVEDRRFYRHGGVDARRVAGAVLRNVREMRYDEGFSTITMQLARNVFPRHLSRVKTLRRKLWEVVLARRIERAFTKDEILEMYLNQIYLGEGQFGVEAAAQGYFGRSVREVTASEAALLAALPKAPSYYTPRKNALAAVRRRNLVLGLMVREGVIDAATAREEASTPIRLVPPLEARGRAPYFVAAVRRALRERFGAEADRAGFRVYTTLDPEMQRNAERELRAQLVAIEGGKFGRFRGAKCRSATAAQAKNCLQGLFVALDAGTGDVLSLVGGRDYALSQFDRVTQAKRQAGSAFKPFVYASAIAAGMPTSMIVVGPGAPEGVAGGYRPADAVGDSVPLDMRDGLRLSSNRVAVALGERVGVARVARTAHDLGITTPVPEYPSTLLGAAEVLPIELVAAYTAFARGGMRASPRLIRRIEDSQGRVVWEAPIHRSYALAPGVAYLTTSLMQGVVDRGTGTGVRTAGLSREIPAAGKTGTTNDAADVWFVGATPDVVAGVWIGFDRPRRILHGASGGGLAAPIWGRVMARHYATRPAPQPWAPTSDLVMADIDRRSGLLATPGCPEEAVVREYFLQGTAPLESCPLHPDEGLGGWLQRAARGLSDWLGGGDDDRAPPRSPAFP